GKIKRYKMAYIGSYKNQNWLLPTSIKQMIPENHISFFVEEFVESLDFSGFDMISDGAGHPSYHPRIIMKVIIQGMLSKERSSRKLASACRENFVFMYLAEKVQPNFRTIARFRKGNGKFIKEVFKETVDLASENGLVDLNIICTDGSKIKANSSKKMCLKKEQIERLDLIIDKMMEEDIQQDEIDKEIYGEKEENITNIEIKNLKGIVKNYREIKNKEKLKEKCKKAIDEFDKDSKIKRVSLSDPECRMMKNKKGVFELDYNPQFTVDSKNQIIVANDVCQDRTDTFQLQPQIKNVQENITLKKDTKIVADCNYNNGENLKFLEKEKLNGYIPTISQAQKLDDRKQKKEDEYEYDKDKDEIILNGTRLKFHAMWKHKGNNHQRYYKSEDGKITKRVPEFFRERLRMKKKLETQEGKQTYSLRKTIVEPVIGNIKYNLGFTEFLVRGLDGAKLELNIASIAHNLKKIWVARGKICKNNEIIIFHLILENNQINCDTACKVCGGRHLILILFFTLIIIPI
ncbi:MAG: IS1182 family transposase, partial [Candidatus Roizmanbacteria bacterium]|nr:IS1182 family transposase [Candidatus Roizmanbacteria bacterium]